MGACQLSQGFRVCTFCNVANLAAAGNGASKAETVCSDSFQGTCFMKQEMLLLTCLCMAVRFTLNVHQRLGLWRDRVALQDYVRWLLAPTQAKNSCFAQYYNTAPCKSWSVCCHPSLVSKAVVILNIWVLVSCLYSRDSCTAVTYIT